MANKEYVVTLTYNCYLGECGQIINDETELNDFSNRIDFEQMEGNVSKDTTKFLIACGTPKIMVTDKETGEVLETVKDSDGDDCSLEDYCEFDADGVNWIEKKLKLKPDSRYYIQFFTPRNGEAFAKNVSFKIKTEGDFDIDKLSLVYDTTFEKLFWKIYNEEEEGRIVGYIMDDFDMGLYTPYEICYDGKTVKANKFSLGRTLCGTAYMTFKWE